MKRFFGRKQGDKIIIEEGEFHHLKSVMRMREGEKVIASLNDDFDYYCTIEKLNKNDCVLSIDSVQKCVGLPNKNVVLFQMLPRKDYLDNIIAKSIELGVSKIVTFSSHNTISKPLKKERLINQIMTACKQCERSKLIEFEDTISFEKMLEELSNFDLVLFPYENETQVLDAKVLNGKNNIAIIVGNETGFTQDEAEKLKQKAISLSLGKRILRCDTAVMAMLSIVNFFTNNWWD